MKGARYWEARLPLEPVGYDTQSRSLGALSLALDLRWMGLNEELNSDLRSRFERAFADLKATEAGAIVNSDEGRMVGHYWLRAPELAPSAEGAQIVASWQQLQGVLAQLQGRFSQVLVVGIGGSALGPQLVADALSSQDETRAIAFLDNTDPDGIARTLARLNLAETLVVVISKSGGTPETRNGMVLAQAAFASQGLDFARQAIAITQEGSQLFKAAERWLARLPMWDWVGGRSSVTSVVGLLPAGLQGLDLEAFLAGAKAVDRATRTPDLADNPAALLAWAWFEASGGQGKRQMVVLPYSDRLVLLSRYLQQLIMESLGKRLDRQGQEVFQGLTVYGNKGSTDQHAYVQQLRDGLSDFFASFIEVLEDGGEFATLEVEAGIRAGDYLAGFLAGTRQALAEAGRKSLTLTVERVDAATLGGLIALFERAVSLYASLIDVNAYHQPGVEAGKKAANALLALQKSLEAALDAGFSGDADAFAAHVGAETTAVFAMLRRLAATGRARSTGEGLARHFAR